MIMAVYQVRLMGGLRVNVGQKVIALDLEPAPTARDLLEALGRAYPAVMPHVFDDDGQLLPDVLVLINSQPVYALNGLTTPVNPSDDVMMIPPLSGG
jgi:molybdopterin synthase sulfur carrier subunit